MQLKIRDFICHACFPGYPVQTIQACLDFLQGKLLLLHRFNTLQTVDGFIIIVAVVIISPFDGMYQSQLRVVIDGSLTDTG
ncbi:hypothetical protein D3C87_1978880 [compost metagenome]